MQKYSSESRQIKRASKENSTALTWVHQRMLETCSRTIEANMPNMSRTVF